MVWLTRISSVGLALWATSGCLQNNPAFDPYADDGTGGSDGSADASTFDTGSEASTTKNGDGDGDGDPSTGNESPDTAAEADPQDLPGDEFCSVPVHGGLNPTFGNPANLDGQACPPDGMEALVRVFGIADGNWMVGMCAGTCSSCNGNQLHPLGAPGLKLADLIPPLINNMDPTAGCFFVETEALVDDGDACSYASLSVFPPEQDFTTPIFAATRDGWGLTSSAYDGLGQFEPAYSQKYTCACADYDPNAQIECCDTAAVGLEFVINDVALFPGEQDIVSAGGAAYTFYAVQAQAGLSCEVPYQISYAMVKLTP